MSGEADHDQRGGEDGQPGPRQRGNVEAAQGDAAGQAPGSHPGVQGGHQHRLGHVHGTTGGVSRCGLEDRRCSAEGETPYGGGGHDEHRVRSDQRECGHDHREQAQAGQRESTQVPIDEQSGDPQAGHRRGPEHQ